MQARQVDRIWYAMGAGLKFSIVNSSARVLRFPETSAPEGDTDNFFQEEANEGL